MTNWCTVPYIMKEFPDLTKGTLYHFMHRHRDSEYVRVSKDGIRQIDMGGLIDRQARIEKLWHQSHEYFYWLTYTVKEEYNHTILAWDLATQLSKETDNPRGAYVAYFSYGMWSRVDDRSILGIELERGLTENFILWCEENIPKIKRNLDANRQTQVRR